MNICYVASNLDSVHDQKLIGHLEKRGHRLTVVSFNAGTIEETAERRFFHLDMSGMRPVNYLVSFVRLIKIARFLRKVLKQTRPDILHGGQVHSEGLFSSLSWFRPFLLMPWGSDILVYARDSLFYRTIARLALWRASAVMCDCLAVKNGIAAISPSAVKKTEIIYYAGIETEKFNPGVNGSVIRERLGWEDKKVLIMTRSYQPIYGVEYFLHSLPEVIRQVPETRVLMCGEGPLRDRFIEMTGELSIQDHVHFTGWIDNADLPRYLNAADIYVSTSLSDGTSSCLMEALCCGLPVVVSDVPANLEWVADGENGYVVPRKDSRELAQRLITLLSDENLQREFGERNQAIGRERADLNTNLDKLDALYRRLAGTTGEGDTKELKSGENDR